MVTLSDMLLLFLEMKKLAEMKFLVDGRCSRQSS